MAGREGKGTILRECLGLPVSPEGTLSPEEDCLGKQWEIPGLSSSHLDGNFEETFDVRLDVDGLEAAAIATERLPFWPYEELLKVPGHV